MEQLQAVIARTASSLGPIRLADENTERWLQCDDEKAYLSVKKNQSSQTQKEI